MGSLHYARDLLRRGERPHAMLSLEMLGWRAAVRGELLAFVGNVASRELVHRTKRAFDDARTGIPTRAVVAPGFLPWIKSSDHWSFWRIGVPAVMITDTGPFRSLRYHRSRDVAAAVDLDRLGAAWRGVLAIVEDLCVR